MNIGFGLLAAEMKTNPGVRIEDLLNQESAIH